MRLTVAFILAVWLFVAAALAAPSTQADTGIVTVTIRCSEDYAETHLEQCGPGPYAPSFHGDAYEPSLERVA